MLGWSVLAPQTPKPLVATATWVFFNNYVVEGFFGPGRILWKIFSFRKSRNKTLLDFLSFVVASCGFFGKF